MSMESEIGELLLSQSRIHSLLNAVGSGKSGTQSRGWYSPADAIIQCIQVADLANESTTITNTNELVALAGRHETDGMLKVLSKNRRFRTNLVQLGPVVYPKQVKACPWFDDIKKRMSQDLFVLSVFGYSGYSFLGEFMHVYKGKLNRETAMNDAMAVLRRALRSCSPTLNDKSCARYAEFIMRMSAWEATLAAPVLEETSKGLFPHWNAHPHAILPESGFQHSEVYVGYNTAGELSFTVRIRCELELRAATKPGDTKAATPTGATTAASTATDVLASNVALELVYYREFVLSDSIIDNFLPAATTTNGANKGGQFVPPPPPPKRAKKTGDSNPEQDDIRVFLLITQKMEPVQPEAEGATTAGASSPTADASSGRRDEEGDQAEEESDAWVGKANTASSSERSLSFCSELYGWGFDASHSLGLGETATSAASRVAANQGPVGATPAESAAEMDANIQELVHGPRRIPIDRLIAIERVRSVACSSTHTLVLTWMGSVFACGENAEGALGTRDFVSRASLTPVEWPTTAAESSGSIVKVAAGSSSIGGHSMAIDRDGRLYGWGVAYAVGVGQIKAITEPTLVPIGAVRDPLYSEHGANPARGRRRGVNEVNGEPQGEVEEDFEFIEDARDGGGGNGSTLSVAQRREVVDVACGGGFTVCVTRAGHVFTWGVWAHGRLGLGPVPVIDKVRGPYRGHSKKIARYQLHPRRILGVEGAVSVSCGEAHALCLVRNGCVLAWGRNSCGQLGTGPSSLGMLADAYRPVLVPHFGSVSLSHGRDYNVGRFAQRSGNAAYKMMVERLLTPGGAPLPQGRLVRCGAFHSACVDERGLVYTWGARGSPCLGHQDAPVVGEWSGRINSIFSISSAENKTMVPFELFQWCATWSMPRLVHALAGGPLQSSAGAHDDLSVSAMGGSIAGQSASSEAHVSAKQRVVQVCTGDLYTAFLTAEGKVFLCGTGPAVPQFAPASRQLKDMDPNEDQNHEKPSGEDKDEDGEGNLAGTTVGSPRCPSDCWLRELCARRVAHIAGSGNRVFVLVDEEVAAHALTGPLLTTLTTSAEDRFKSGSVSDSDSHLESVFENRGKADCMILASGKVFLCHKALLAQRSPELRDMIIMETPTDHSSGQLVQILLPELQRDAARALLYYLYRDVLPQWCIGSTSLLTSLARTGKTLRIPRLQLLCDRFLRLLRSSEPSLDRDAAAKVGDLELPPPTLARDLSALVGDPEFADVRFIAEGRAIVAHRFILEARCAYFRGMFRSGMAESGGGEYGAGGHRSGEMVDVVVPDTFVGFLRLLIFIYTGTLPDGSDGALLEDLMAADRYVIPDMKLLCENMLVPSESNWLDLLRAAQLLNSLRLELQVMAFLKTNFSVLKGLYNHTAEEGGSSGQVNGEDDGSVQYSNVADFQEEFPGLLEDLLSARKVIFPLPPSKLMIDQCTESSNALAAASGKDRPPVFPVWALVVAAVAFFLYQHVSKIIALGPMIPIINSVASLAFIVLTIRYFNFNS